MIGAFLGSPGSSMCIPQGSLLQLNFDLLDCSGRVVGDVNVDEDHGTVDPGLTVEPCSQFDRLHLGFSRQE
jgi:hypothetical protein